MTGEHSFDVKHLELLTNRVTGYPGAHPDLRAMLEWLGDYCAARKMMPPYVTCFGRTRAEQEEIYLPLYLQELHDIAAARAKARGRFSWHCIPLTSDGRPGLCRAMDLRYSIWSDADRAALMRAARVKWPHAELLDHAVPGGGRHLHFGVPDPAGRPSEWL